MNRRHATTLGAIALVVGLSALRLVNLDADPPPYLDLSGGSYADEGPWLHNARNLLLYGTTRTDGWNPMLLSPLTHLSGFASMAVLGVGLPQARVSAAVVFLLILTGLALWPSDRRVAVVAVVLFGTNYVAAMFGRLVLVDNMVLALSAGAAALLCAALRRPGGGMLLAALAGGLAALALITKILVVFLVPAWYAALAVEGLTRRRPLREIGRLTAAFTVSLAGTYAAYVVLVRWPNAKEMAVYLEFYRSQQALSPLGVVKNLISQRFFAYFSWTPLFLVLFLWACWGRVVELWRRRTLPPADEVLALAWFVGGLCLLSALRYRPLRYYLVLLPPMAYITSVQLCRLACGEALGLPRPLLPLRLIATAAAATALGLFLDGSLWGWRYSGLEGGMGVSLPRLAALAVLAGAVALVPHRLSRLAGPRAAAWLLGAYLASNLGSTLAWVVQPEYTLRDASADLARRLPADAVVSGQFAIQLAFGTSLRAVPVWGGYYNADRPFERYGISHLLLWTYNRGMEIRNFAEYFPDAMRRAQVVHRYRIKRSDVLLYEVR